MDDKNINAIIELLTRIQGFLFVIMFLLLVIIFIMCYESAGFVNTLLLYSVFTCLFFYFAAKGKELKK